MAMLRSGSTGAIALSRDPLAPLAAQLPRSRITGGNFHETGIAIPVPKNRPQALAFVTAFLQAAKTSGIVRQALDRAGFPSEAVAP
jgi:polar amino acid transport system substrate-binding protein